MKVLFDFGISQEDPLTEQRLLDIQPSDRVLSVASGGEVPLALLCLNENPYITAVDVSLSQIMLCRLKLLAAIHVDFPLNGQFLGYSPMKRSKRNELFKEFIQHHLNENEIAFWELHKRDLENGVVNSGRFERYITKMRFIARLLIGNKNLEALISSKSLEEQEGIFQTRIATRKSLHMLFKIAFHPKLYKKRGLQEQALIHARTDTGERFYRRFESFCTGSLASTNYFLQYFITGKLSTSDAYPDYLQPQNRRLLLSNITKFELKPISFQDALREKGKGYFNKIHLSNLGDWLDSNGFSEVIKLLKGYCPAGTKICYRYLQKDHLAATGFEGILVDRSVSGSAQKNDRFPFYTTFLMTISNDKAVI